MEHESQIILAKLNLFFVIFTKIFCEFSKILVKFEFFGFAKRFANFTKCFQIFTNSRLLNSQTISKGYFYLMFAKFSIQIYQHLVNLFYECKET